MKKILITSVCTLVLSLIGAFGSNQNYFASERLKDINSSTTQVVDNVTKADAVRDSQSDKQTTITANTADTTNITAFANTKVVTPQVKSASVINTSQSLKSKAALVYKNVDLSKCKSTKEVVKTLQKNGFKNITTKNIKKNKKLKEIIAAIQKRNYKTGSVTVPTKAPVATTKPSPTKTPTPTTKPAVSEKPVTTPAASTKSSSYASEVLRLVNIERAKSGLSAFTTNQTLGSAANKRAKEIEVSFSHTRPSGASFSTVLKEYGISFMAAGENIAYGQKTPQEVVTGWMNSPGHRANILNAKFNKIGIGVYQKDGVYYWTQLFTN
jgi:uncharacterized protein YkwD